LIKTVASSGILLCAGVLLWSGAASAQSKSAAPRKNYDQTTAETQARKGQTSAGPLIDHGGPVLASSKTYAIYWGTASDFPTDLQGGMGSLLSGFNGSSYLGIAQQYMHGSAVSTTYMGPVFDASVPPAKSPTAAEIGAEVCKLFPSPDPNAVYIVFTSNAPKINFCAWHSAATCNGVTIQVAFIPNQELLPGCSPYVATNLHCNGYSEGTVASADSVAHEFMESITDPHLNAWYDRTGQEIGDKCNFVYESCVSLSSGAWQIQSEWSNAINACQQQ
jgi:hypothetical protein